MVHGEVDRTKAKSIMKHWTRRISTAVDSLIGRQAETSCLEFRKWSMQQRIQRSEKLHLL